MRFNRPNVEQLENKRNVPGLLKALVDEEHLIRQAAAIALGRLKDPRSIEPLIAALSDHDSSVRHSAARILGEFKDPRAIPRLAATLGDEDRGTRRAALTSLSQFGGLAVEPLLAALDGQSEFARAAAAEALGLVGDARAIQPLQHAALDRNANVRAAASQALETVRSRVQESERAAALAHPAPSPAAPQPVLPARLVRVFISSTFRDMQAERDLLIKQIFPELRQRCRARQVEFIEVDLRWGVTEEQAERGEVLPICLAEIDNCRPYFICLLGERYGWVPDRLQAELVEGHPWLTDHPAQSVTEFEILYGVLNQPAMADRALFYFRDPAFVDRVPPDQRADYISESPAAKEKLDALKARIRASGLPLVDGYRDPAALGTLILEQMWRAIDQRFPAGSEPAPLDRERVEHEAFAASRARVYVGRQEYIDRLNQHVQSADPPLVLLGDPGAGKSALVANWARQYRQNHPKDLVFLHFIGATPSSTDYAALLRRLMGELKQWGNIVAEIPDAPDKLREAFPNWLAMAATRGRVVLILDALNQLEDRDNALALGWLPEVIPPQVRAILSTLPGPALAALSRRGWPTLTLKGLRPEERTQLIDQYLDQYRKRLSRERVQRIATADQTANPLYLRALLEELRVFGIHERLDERIQHYLQAESVPKLYERILTRLEQDYARDRDGLVRESMSLLWAARRGISESELLQLLGSRLNPLPRAGWSPLFLALQESLLNRSGLLNFFHPYLRQAVEAKYLPTEEAQRAARSRLADYFCESALDHRRIEEGLWQLDQLRDWDRLAHELKEPAVLALAWKQDPFDVRSYWTRLEKHSPFRVLDAYQPLFALPIQAPEAVRAAAKLAADLGYLQQATPLHANLAAYYRQQGNAGELASALTDWAGLLAKQNDLDAASQHYQEAEQLYRDANDVPKMLGALSGQAAVLWLHEKLAQALEASQRLERLSREHSERAPLFAALQIQANVLMAQGNGSESFKLFQLIERFAREDGNQDLAAAVLLNQAAYLDGQGDHQGALAALRQAEQICRQLGNKYALEAALRQQAQIQTLHGDLAVALALHQERAALFRVTGDSTGLLDALGAQAGILASRGELDAAMACNREIESLARAAGNLAPAIQSLRDQAQIVSLKKDDVGILRYYEFLERLCREADDQQELSKVLIQRARLASETGRFQDSLKDLGEVEQMARAINSREDLQNVLKVQVLVLQQMNDPNVPLTPLEHLEELAEQGGDKNLLAESLGMHATLLAGRNEMQAARDALGRAAALWAELGDDAGRAGALAGQATLAKLAGDMEQARQLAEQAHQIATARGLTDIQYKISPLLASLGGQVPASPPPSQQGAKITLRITAVPGFFLKMAQPLIQADPANAPQTIMTLAGRLGIRCPQCGEISGREKLVVLMAGTDMVKRGPLQQAIAQDRRLSKLAQGRCPGCGGEMVELIPVEN